MISFIEAHSSPALGPAYGFVAVDTSSTGTSFAEALLIIRDGDPSFRAQRFRLAPGCLESDAAAVQLKSWAFQWISGTLDEYVLEWQKRSGVSFHPSRYQIVERSDLDGSHLSVLDLMGRDNLHRVAHATRNQELREYVSRVFAIGEYAEKAG